MLFARTHKKLGLFLVQSHLAHIGRRGAAGPPGGGPGRAASGSVPVVRAGGRPLGVRGPGAGKGNMSYGP